MNFAIHIACGKRFGTPRSFLEYYQKALTESQETLRITEAILRNATKTLWNSNEVYEMPTKKLAWNATKMPSGIQKRYGEYSKIDA